MKNQKFTKNTVSLLVLGTIMVVSYQNCAPGSMSSAKGSASSASTSPPVAISGDGTPTNVIDYHATAVNNSENIVTTMQNQLGVTTLSKATLTTIGSQISKIPASTKPDSVNGPEWVAITAIGGNICDDLVTQEKALAAASRRFFSQIDFTKGPASQTAASKDDSISRLARAVWARNETPTEHAAIRASMDASFTSTTVADTANEMLFACTAMIASLDAQRY